MSITKAQWVEIEEDLKQWMVCVEFKLDEHSITVQRCSNGEGKTVLGVFLDGEIKGEWYIGENRPFIIEKIWHPRSKALYSKKYINDIEKLYGKRQAKKEFPNLHERQTWFEPMFSKASILVRQFKKIDGLILVKKEGV